MKASEVISILSEIIRKHGDRDVMAYNHEYQEYQDVMEIIVHKGKILISY